MLKHGGSHSSKLVILVGFLSIFSLFVALISIAIFSISNNSESLLEIVKEQEEVANIFSMRDSVYKRNLLLYQMNNLSDPFLKDDLYMQFKEAGGDFIAARDTLLSTNKSTAQVKSWQKIQPLVVEGVKSQQLALEFILNDKTKLAKKALKSVLPKNLIVMSGLTKMLENENLTIKGELILTQEKNDRYHSTIISLGILATILSFGIAYLVYHYITKTEQILIVQQEIANSSNKAKTTFLANMSHEIRTPLTAIIGFTEQILNKNLSFSEKNTIQQTIIKNSKHLQTLINKILDLSKIESGQLVVEMTATSPAQVNYEVKSIIAKRAQDKGLFFVISNKHPLPSSIITDVVRLKQILLNLCSNAIKFTSEGKIILDTIYDPEKNQISFLVTDTGIGLSEDEQDKIFNPFIQADATTTRKYGGTGLGLSISSLLATELGGSLKCKSTKNKGSQFTLTLPTGISGKIKMINPIEPIEIDTSIPNNSLENLNIRQLEGNILLAEDVKDNQALISMYVKQTGAHLDIVSNGEEAINKALKNEYSLILMDMQMPKIDGIEAISILRKKGYTKPIVSLTANAMSFDREKCLNAGANKFLAKPINMSEFYDTLNTYLKEQDNPAQIDNLISHIKLEEFKNKFITDLTLNISQLNNALSEQSWDEIDKISHNLMGRGTTFGYKEVTDSARKINRVVREKNYEAATDLIQDFTSILNKIIESEINK